MAGERIGKTYEALLRVVLDRLKAKCAFDGEVFWNETPEGISVEPDFSIGPDEDHPAIIIMVTHSGSSKNSDMKCWRNLGELCEAKTHLTPMPFAISVVYDSVMKADLKQLQDAAFDGQLIVGDRTYGAGIKKWVVFNEPNLPVDQNEMANILAERQSVDAELSQLLDLFETDLQECLSHRKTDLDQLWSLEQQRPHFEAPLSRKTSVRRGISKLLVFEDLNLGIKLYRGKKVCIDEVPNYIYSIGFAKKAIGRAVPCDAEIQDAINLLDDRKLHVLYHTMDDNEIVQGWLKQLRYITNVEFMTMYVNDEFEALCNPEELYNRLMQLYYDPNALVNQDDAPEQWPPANVWLFDTIIEFIKASTGKSNGYGYAQLAAEISEPNGIAREYSESTRAFLLSPWGHLSEWTSRSSHHCIPDEVLFCVALVLSSKLLCVGKANLKKISTNLADSFAHNIIEAKLCTYRGFSPLAVLMIDEKVFSSLSDTINIRTCFAEKAELSGQSGKTTVIQVKNTIINWQTATDAGKDHKRKELCGRAVGLRYTWDVESQQFVPRPGVQKLILLLDGTWRQKDLDALVCAGWDEIYYPDEIDKLKATII